METSKNGNSWKLEVVRGKDAGRSFALGTGEVVLGNAPGDRGGLDLAFQEPDSSPRRMAARHALIACSPDGLSLRDLESPGGTFVNRQRILPGQAKPLAIGDVIQLGSVQLKVVASESPVLTRVPSPSSAHAGPFAYPIPGGPICRSWDDILTASAQRWDALREELVSGRLASFLISVGRGELAPSPLASDSPDERLDAWLGGLPTTREARPELDVHPARLVIRASPGGGTIRRSVQVANVGYRLLKSTARVEPLGVPWLELDPSFAGQAFLTIEGTDLDLVIHVPETLPSPLSAELVIEGNGGSKRIPVILEAKAASGGVVEPGGSSGPAMASGLTLRELIARQTLSARLATWSFACLVIRLLVGVASGSIGADSVSPSGPDSPGLLGVSVMLAGVGGVLGGVFAGRRGGSREIPTGAFSGGFAGVAASAVLVAVCRSVEPVLGSWSTSVIAVCGLWAVMGGVLAGLSILFVKGKS